MPAPSFAATAALMSWRSALQGLHVLESQSARFQKIGDKQARRSAEQIEEVTHQAPAILLLIDGRLKQLRVADLLDSTESPFLFQPVDQRLNGRVSDPLILRQAVEDFAHRANSQLPALFENPGFSLAESRLAHQHLLHDPFILLHDE